jgi:hypothetical protein
MCVYARIWSTIVVMQTCIQTDRSANVRVMRTHGHLNT